MIIITDMSEVLIGGFYGIKPRIARDIGRDEGDAFETRRNEKTDILLDLFRGKIKEEEYWDTVFDGQNFPRSLNKNSAKYYLDDATYQKVDGTYNLYMSIASHPRSLDSAEMLDGRPDIYIASDYMKERVERIKIIHPKIFRMIKKSFWSFDLGYVKGDKEFFPEVIKQIGQPVNKLVFIDDLECNIKSAKANGIYSIQFKNAEQLKKELADIGFTFV